MTREQAQILRLILMCVAWAVASTLVVGISFGPTDLVIPAILAAGVYAVTDDLGRTHITEAGKYYRGRRIDDDPPRSRWN